MSVKKENPNKNAIDPQNGTVRDSSDSVKSFQDLTLADNFLFCQVMRDKSICTEFLNSLLGIRIAELQYVVPENTLDNPRPYRSFRLDVFAKDIQGNAYNIEMQKEKKPALAMRLRSYSAAMDRDLLQRGADYPDLPRNIVVMVCDFDMYGQGLARYQVHRMVDERDCGFLKDFQDGSEIFFLNAKFRVNNVSENIVDFLHLVEGETAATDFGQNVTRQIADVKSDRRLEEQYMTIQEWADELAEEAKEKGFSKGREKGREEGREEGVASALLSVIRNMTAAKCPVETIAQAIGKTVEETAELQKKLTGSET